MKSPIPGTISIAVISLAALALTGCSPAMTLKITPSSRDAATFEASLSQTAEGIVRKFTDKETTEPAPGPRSTIYDREAILLSLGNAGFRADTLEFPGRTGIKLALTLARSDGFLGNALVVSKAEHTARIDISRDTLARAVELMPAETREYLDLFMAPAFTGETMTEAEYREVIAAAYGKTLAAELAASSFTLTVQCPSAVTRATINAPGTVVKANNAAVFRVPLTTLLTLSSPISAEAAW